MNLFNIEPSINSSNENITEFVLEIEEQKVKVTIIVEKRRGSRISFTKKGIVVRLNHFLTHAQKQEQTKVFLDWAKEKIIKHPTLVSQYNSTRRYVDGDVLRIYGEDFLIRTTTDNSKFATIKIRAGELVLVFPAHTKVDRRDKVASRLVAKIMATYFQAKVLTRIQALNALYFQKKVAKVTLKNNTSNWGSCSIRNNINISTRLLFAPDFVIEYVFIHELTHLVHMDHSDRFWNHVESIMPNYEEAEKWLKVHGNECCF